MLMLWNAGSEALDSDFRFRKAARLQRFNDRFHHSFGTAHERRVDFVQAYPVRQQRVGPLAIDSSVQEVDVLCFP